MSTVTSKITALENTIGEYRRNLAESTDRDEMIANMNLIIAASQELHDLRVLFFSNSASIHFANEALDIRAYLILHFTLFLKEASDGTQLKTGPLSSDLLLLLRGQYQHSYTHKPKNISCSTRQISPQGYLMCFSLLFPRS
jgi:hypothetical protein